MTAEPAADDLRDRLARLEDERAIVATLYRYGDALDHGDRDQFLDCFTPDAVYEVRMRLDAGNDFTHTGHDELRAYFDGHTHAPAAYHKHVTVNPMVTVRSGTAEAQSYFLRVDAPAAGPAVVLASGRYVDRLERDDDGRWRIRSRRCEVENL
jgi:3-phenylpropionate/cinnamic acid dioxygenase small subunit